MTQETCLIKIEQLKKVALAQTDKRIDIILNSGFIDLENEEDNFLIPIVVLCASLQYAASQLKPLNNHGKEILQNINLI